MGLTPFWSQPPVASQCIAVLVTSVLVSQERAGCCRLVITHFLMELQVSTFKINIFTGFAKLSQ